MLQADKDISGFFSIFGPGSKYGDLQKPAGRFTVDGLKQEPLVSKLGQKEEGNFLLKYCRHCMLMVTPYEQGGGYVRELATSRRLSGWLYYRKYLIISSFPQKARSLCHILITLL